MEHKETGPCIHPLHKRVEIGRIMFRESQEVVVVGGGEQGAEYCSLWSFGGVVDGMHKHAPAGWRR